MQNDDEKELEKVDESEVKDEEKKEEQHEPKEGSKRWNEIYGKWKTSEREIEGLKQKDSERDAAFKELLEHNKKLSKSIIGVEDQLLETSKPDKDEDPEGYEKWLTDKIKRDVQKTETPKPVQQPQQQKPPQAAPIEEIEFAAGRDDYWQIIGEVNRDIQADQNLMGRIFATSNPYEAGYRYGKAKLNKKANERKALEDQGFVEESSSKVEKKTVLTKEQEYAAQMLGISKDKYAEQLQIIEQRSK